MAESQCSCAQVALNHEASVNAFAEELKTLAVATQVLQSETGQAEGTDVFADSGKFSCWCADNDRSRRIRSGDSGVALRQEGALSWQQGLVQGEGGQLGVCLILGSRAS